MPCSNFFFNHLSFLDRIQKEFFSIHVKGSSRKAKLWASFRFWPVKLLIYQDWSGLGRGWHHFVKRIPPSHQLFSKYLEEIYHTMSCILRDIRGDRVLLLAPEELKNDIFIKNGWLEFVRDYS